MTNYQPVTLKLHQRPHPPIGRTYRRTIGCLAGIGRFSPGPPPFRHAPRLPKIRIEDVWERYEDNSLDATDATLDDYKQIFRRFLKWTQKRAPVPYRGKVRYASDVTSELCREYVIQVAAEKTTGMRDKNILHSIWETVFPAQANPWNVGVKPKVKQRDPAAKSRRLFLDEARRFRAAILAEANEWSGKNEGKRSNVLTPELLHDLYDAVAFSWWYGMRVGSLCALKWEDFRCGDWFLHVPPKTERRRPDPLQLPIVPEIAAILARRKNNATSEWLFPHLNAQYNKRGKVVEREFGFQMRRSANRTGQYELARDVKKLFRKAKIPDDFNGRASMHGFRKSCANNLSDHGYNDHLICSILGWASRSGDMTNRYIMGQTLASKKEALLIAIPPLERELQDV